MLEDAYHFLVQHEDKFQIDPGTGCMVWQGAKTGDYPIVKVEGKKQYAHRHVCELAHGAPRPGDEASHTCDNPSCVNPAHLLWETKAQNLARQNNRKPNARLNGNKWYSRFTCHGKRRTSPGFSTIREAEVWYCAQVC